MNFRSVLFFPVSIAYRQNFTRMCVFCEFKIKLSGKAANKRNECICNDAAAKAHIERVALTMFEYADRCDRSGIYSKNVIKSFYTSANLIDVLSLFGEQDEKLLEVRKYGRWKAAYLFSCLKSGEKPIPGPVEEKELLDEDRDQGETEVSDVCTKISKPIEPPLPISEFPEDDGCADLGIEESVLRFEEFAKAQKFCKYAMNALEYEDAQTAVKNLKQALELLQKYTKD
ncbi:Vacuolar protein sorting-associated protein VTA1 -like protein [Trichinella pseudospiralis]|uniref:Vacuolar protein sorting-associated protein VTA1-like protein n=1 Tax=Trichinella pseudospiralis TaxID=6337 RepID=A0A0V0XLE9_TRIPS|nr:Vacuolar protein sorting-associated protein VTA1 -like protein [Trichinella pseudospiralis]